MLGCIFLMASFALLPGQDLHLWEVLRTTQVSFSPALNSSLLCWCRCWRKAGMKLLNEPCERRGGHWAIFTCVWTEGAAPLAALYAEDITVSFMYSFFSSLCTGTGWFLTLNHFKELKFFFFHGWCILGPYQCLRTVTEFWKLCFANHVYMLFCFITPCWHAAL